ncbi:MAG: hypothetical protein JWO03_2878 [Bacteroidetes bacterium]|nr:hypothetical protein [Bacteroidota bacterium]
MEKPVNHKELSPSYGAAVRTVTGLIHDLRRMSAQDIRFVQMAKELDAARTSANLYRKLMVL